MFAYKENTIVEWMREKEKESEKAIEQKNELINYQFQFFAVQINPFQINISIYLSRRYFSVYTIILW